MDITTPRVHIAAPLPEMVTLGEQEQYLIPCISTDQCGSRGISAGLVVMPPCHMSKAHKHERSEIIVTTLDGFAVTLVGDALVPHGHGPGEFIYVPAGVVHVAINMSVSQRLYAMEMRTDPTFRDDVVLTPEFDDAAIAIAADLRRNGQFRNRGRDLESMTETLRAVPFSKERERPEQRHSRSWRRARSERIA